MFPSFATQEALFTAAKYVSASEQKYVSVLGQKHIPVLQNWETSGKHVSAANFSGNMFPHFARA